MYLKCFHGFSYDTGTGGTEHFPYQSEVQMNKPEQITAAIMKILHNLQQQALPKIIALETQNFEVPVL